MFLRRLTTTACWTREYRSWNGSLFIGDHFRATSTFTLDVGLRYERIGQFTDALGLNSSFDISQANPNPPASGSLAGYVVAANYSATVRRVLFEQATITQISGRARMGLLLESDSHGSR